LGGLLFESFHAYRGRRAFALSPYREWYGGAQDGILLHNRDLIAPKLASKFYGCFPTMRRGLAPR